MTITIRRTCAKDAAGMAQLMSDPTIFGGLLQMPYPSEERWHARLTETSPAGHPGLSLVAERDGAIVGSAGLDATGVSPRRRHAMGLGLLVARAAQRQGVGSALMAAVCDYADNWLGTLRIELTVYADNDVALRLYARFGFELEGRFRRYALRDGVYVDALAMARLHPNPPGLAVATG
jgi:L-phenylalanine/L-methionine N-acetyltransferase